VRERIYSEHRTYRKENRSSGAIEIVQITTRFFPNFHLITFLLDFQRKTVKLVYERLLSLHYLLKNGTSPRNIERTRIRFLRNCINTWYNMQKLYVCIVRHEIFRPNELHIISGHATRSNGRKLENVIYCCYCQIEKNRSRCFQNIILQCI